MRNLGITIALIIAFIVLLPYMIVLSVGVLFYHIKQIMKKEIKQLSSRQDVLDVWVSKGAELYGVKLHNVVGIYGTQAIFSNVTKKSRNCFCIYEILYSPESNFFEVMFDERPGIYGKSIIELRHKANCVNHSDPLQYILDNLT